MLSLPFFYIRYRIARGRAVATFKREMIAAGITQREAKDLADLYPFRFSDLLKLTRTTNEI